MTKINKLTLIKADVIRDKYNKIKDLYRCYCGNKFIAYRFCISNKHTKSCGCYNKKCIAERSNKHGQHGSRTYISWHSMKQRCLNKNHKNFNYYGGRGIKIYQEWLKFENFYKDMGDRPKGLSLDRINNDGNYEPSNCRWATREIQMNNTRKQRIIGIKNE